MKIKSLLLLLLSSLLFVAACSDNSSSSKEEDTEKTAAEENVDEKENESTEEDSEEAAEEVNEEEETGLSEEEALSIAKDINESLLATAKSDDIDGFRSLYSANMDEAIVNQDFEFFKSNLGNHEELDVKILFHTDDIIGASIVEYTNLASETGDLQHSNNSYKLYLENIDGEWVFSTSEKVQEANVSVFLPKLNEIFGQEFVDGGFTNGAHSYLFDVVLTNNTEANIYKMKLNDDNSLDVVLAIQNGLNNDIYNVTFSELILSSGDSVPFADLSGYALDSTDIVESKTIKHIPVTIAAEDLLVEPSEIDMNYIGVSSKMNYDNRAE